MKKSKFSDAQVAHIVQQQQRGMRVKDICLQHGISMPTFYVWKTRRARTRDKQAAKPPPPSLERELALYKRIVAEQQLFILTLQDELIALEQQHATQHDPA